MKISKLLSVNKKDVGPFVFVTLKTVAPEGITACGDFSIEAIDVEEGKFTKVDTVRELLRGFGLKLGKFCAKGQFEFEVVRKYEDSDLSTAELLRLKKQGSLLVDGARGLDCYKNGALSIKSHDVRHGFRLGGFDPNLVVVSNSVRVIFENAGLRGLSFQEVNLLGKMVDLTDPPLWVLGSNLVMPKLLNSHQFIHPGMTVTPFTGDYAKIIQIQEPPYRSGELHYLRKDVETVNGFDAAFTFEKIGHFQPTLIVSQHFYRTCLENEIPIIAEPVRIDTD